MSSTIPLPNTTAPPQEEEYEAGRVICQVCGVGIAFRDEATNEFTMKHWDAHRLAWYCHSFSFSFATLINLIYQARPHLPLDPGLESPSFTLLKVPQRLWPILPQSVGVLNGRKKNASSTSNQTPTSQSLKPTASFVPLATSGFVLDQIPLTVPYPGMPIVRVAWPKRCGLYNLSFRKTFLHLFSSLRNNKNVYALEERNTLFSKDPDVRKFDAERLLCNMCDKWMNVPSDDHLQAVQKWLQHRASCQKTASSSTTMP